MCHISGNLLFAAYNNCNLQLKMIPGKRKRKNENRKSNKRRKLSTKETAKEEFEENYFYTCRVPQSQIRHRTL